jgi:Transmembrane secretion effector
MRDARMIFLRNGAYRWHLYEDLKHPNKFRMEVVVPSWKEHLLQSERMTKNEKDILLKLRGLRIDANPPEEWISLSLWKRKCLTEESEPGAFHQLILINKLRQRDSVELALAGTLLIRLGRSIARGLRTVADTRRQRYSPAAIFPRAEL